MEVKRFITLVQIPRIAICTSKHVLRHLCQLQWHGLVVARRMNQWWKIVRDLKNHLSPSPVQCQEPKKTSGEARLVESVEVRHSVLLFTYCTTFQCSVRAYLCNPYTENMQQLAWGISLCNKAASAGSCVNHRNTQTFALFHMLFIDTQSRVWILIKSSSSLIRRRWQASAVLRIAFPEKELETALIPDSWGSS
jgi:hypothetical protein